MLEGFKDLYTNTQYSVAPNFKTTGLRHTIHSTFVAYQPAILELLSALHLSTLLLLSSLHCTTLQTIYPSMRFHVPVTLSASHLGLSHILSTPQNLIVYHHSPHKTNILGKLEYFTNLNLAAIKGDDFPQSNHDSRLRENSEVVIYNLPRNKQHLDPFCSTPLETHPGDLQLSRNPHVFPHVLWPPQYPTSDPGGGLEELPGESNAETKLPIKWASHSQLQ